MRPETIQFCAYRRVFLVVAVSVAFCVATTYPVAQSQTRPTDNPPASFVQKVVSAERVEQVQLPVLDGDVLNDAGHTTISRYVEVSVPII